MAPEWFKTAIQGPAYGQHMRRPGLNPFYSETLLICNCFVIQDVMEEFVTAMTKTIVMIEMDQREKYL